MEEAFYASKTITKDWDIQLSKNLKNAAKVLFVIYQIRHVCRSGEGNLRKSNLKSHYHQINKYGI